MAGTCDGNRGSIGNSLETDTRCAQSAADDHFFDLGGDSLAAVELVIAAEAEGVSITAEQVYTFPVLAALAQEVDGHWCRSLAVSCDKLRQDPVFSLRWSQNSGVSDSSPRTSDAPHILLTGATGFLGGAVLRQLLSQTDATISCLVRARTDTGACERLDTLGLSAEHRARLRPLRGDLFYPHFGLSGERWRNLGDQINTIYHCAADVNLVKPYQALRAANVLGTQYILELMQVGQPKVLHYASTLSVFVGSEKNTGIHREDSSIEDVGAVYGGYAQSKWVAESVVRRAAAVAGRASIYRFGLLTGDSLSGASPHNDWLRLVVQGLMTLGAVPEFRGVHTQVDITPVDYAAAAMVRLSHVSSPTQISTFHIANSRGATMGDLIAALRRSGANLAVEPREHWAKRAAGACLSPKVAAALLGAGRFLPARATYQRTRACDVFQATGAVFDTSNTDRGLANSGLCCPKPTPELLDRYVMHMLKGMS